MVVGYCRTCRKSIEIKNSEIKAMRNRPMDYFLGNCSNCNRRISVIKGKNNSGRFNKLTNKHTSIIEETKMQEFFNLSNLTWEEQINFDKFLSAFKKCVIEKIKKDL